MEREYVVFFSVGNDIDSVHYKSAHRLNSTCNKVDARLAIKEHKGISIWKRAKIEWCWRLK